MVVKVHGDSRILRLDIGAQLVAEPRVRRVAKLKKLLPILVPGPLAGHVNAVLFAEEVSARRAPASEGLAEAVVEHVEMEAHDVVLHQLVGHLFGMLEVPAVVAKPVLDVLSLGVLHAIFRKLSPRRRVVLDLLVDDDRHVMLGGFVEAFAEQVAAVEIRTRPGNAAGIEGKLEILHEQDDVLGVGRHALLDPFLARGLRHENVVAVVVACGTDLDADLELAIPRDVPCRPLRGCARRCERGQSRAQRSETDGPSEVSTIHG